MPHINEKLDHCVEVYIVHGRHCLLRIHDKYGIWLAAGGHIELGEDPNEAAIREVKEEVGLNVRLVPRPIQFPNTKTTQLVAPVYSYRHFVNPTHEHSVLVYYGISDTDKLDLPEGREKSREVRWFSLSELDDPKWGVSEDVRFFAKSAILRLSTV